MTQLRTACALFGLFVLTSVVCVAEDLPLAGASNICVAGSTAFSGTSGPTSHFNAFDVQTGTLMGRLSLPAPISTSLHRRFQSAPFETAISRDPSGTFGVFFIPTDSVQVGMNGSVTIVDSRSGVVKTSIALANPVVYDILLDTNAQRAFCVYRTNLGPAGLVAIDYSVPNAPVIFGSTVLAAAPANAVTRASIDPTGNYLYVPLTDRVVVIQANNASLPVVSSISIPTNSQFVATNVDTNFYFQGISNPPWNICATSALTASSLQGANVLVFDQTGGVVHSLPVATGFGQDPISGRQYLVTSGHNDIATISGWAGSTNPAYVLLRTDPAGGQGAVGVIDNVIGAGGLKLSLATTPGEPFANPHTIISPNEITFVAYDSFSDYVCRLNRAYPPGAVVSTSLSGFIQASEVDFPVMTQGKTAVGINTSSGIELFDYALASLGTFGAGGPAASHLGAWRGSMVYPLLGLADGSTTSEVLRNAGSPPTLYPFPATGGRFTPPNLSYPFVVSPPLPPYASPTLGSLLGPRRPAYQRYVPATGPFEITISYDAAGGTAVAVDNLRTLTQSVIPLPAVTGYNTVVLSTEILSF
ncbi:MAG: hypothetical protein RL885_14955 [Planctomycetota bacterium]